MDDDPRWWRVPEGPERDAARRAVRQREAARRRRAANIPPERLQRVEFRGKPAWKGPGKVVHTFTNEAEEQVAIRLARTYAPPFPRDLLTAEIHDGQLILACKTRDYRFPIRLDMDVPPFLFAATIDHLREAELEHRAATAHEPTAEVPQLKNDNVVIPNPGNEPKEEQCDSIPMKTSPSPMPEVPLPSTADNSTSPRPATQTISASVPKQSDKPSNSAQNGKPSCDSKPAAS